jgi:hypothetical protein
MIHSLDLRRQYRTRSASEELKNTSKSFSNRRQEEIGPEAVPWGNGPCVSGVCRRFSISDATLLDLVRSFRVRGVATLPCVEWILTLA